MIIGECWRLREIEGVLEVDLWKLLEIDREIKNVGDRLMESVGG